jgi:hypothetical protein
MADKEHIYATKPAKTLSRVDIVNFAFKAFKRNTITAEDFTKILDAGKVDAGDGPITPEAQRLAAQAMADMLLALKPALRPELQAFTRQHEIRK